MKPKCKRSKDGVSLQPPEKRVKTEPVTGTTDFLVCLPPEISLQIFLNLRNEDLFLACSIVSKTWKDFLNGSYFWEGLIVREFGADRTRPFLRIDGALERFRNELIQSPAFRSDFFVNPIERAKTTVHLSSDASFVEFLREVRLHAAQFLRLDERSDFIKSVDAEDDWAPCWWLWKTSSLFTEAMDILKPVIVYGDSTSDFLEDETRLLYLLDSNLKSLKTITAKDFDNNMVFVRDYPAGVRFICGKRFLYSFRIVPPSLCRILELTHKVRIAMELDNFEEVERIFNADPGLTVNYSRVNDRKFCDTPLGRAMDCETPIERQVFGLFIDRGEFPLPAIEFAIRCNCIVAVELLFARGVIDATTKCRDGMPLLAHAFTSNGPSKKVANFLRSQGADVNGCDENGTTILMYVCKKASIDCIRYLIKHGADVNKLNKKNQSALQFALKCEIRFSPVRLEALLEAGADVNVPFVLEDGSRSTALVEAARMKELEPVTVFVKYGADLDTKDSLGHTAFDYAKKAPEILSVLRSAANKKKKQKNK